ncbi:hypothetical protein EZS27_006972 [termite gut metagenome]|uniref:NigD-like C-terminal beta sandwich domain-containing protein n=1 Tax=termite gut metagenome TaxID=433724 RepID=A0A5J4SH48_9ZZZZ
MKQVQFFVMAIAVFMGISFSSCLSSNEDPITPTRVAWATVESSDYLDMDYFFRLDSGEKLIPTAGISNAVLTGVKRVFITYTYDNIDEFDAQNLISDPAKREYHVSITYALNLEDERNVTNLTAHDTTNPGDSLTTKYYAPITSIDTLWIKDNYLSAWVNYDMSGNKMHFLTLFRYRNDALRLGENDAPDTLDVYLGHNGNGDTYYDTTSKNLANTDMRYVPLYFKAFNIASVMYNVAEDIAPSNLVLNVITRQVLNSRDTINVSYPVKYN